METNYDHSGNLNLTWYVPSFIPGYSGEGELSEFREELNPELLSDEDFVTQYHSIPELLLAVRQISEQAGFLQQITPENVCREYGGADALYHAVSSGFYQIVMALWEQAGNYRAAVDVLNDQYNRKRAFVDYWQAYRHTLGRMRNITSFADKVPAKTDAAIQEFLSLSLPQEHEIYSLFRAAFRAAEAIHATRQDIKSNLDPQVYRNFAEMASGFFRAFLNEEEEQEAGKKLHQMANWVREASDRYAIDCDRTKKDKWSSTYRQSLWKQMVWLTTHVCKMLCTRSELHSDHRIYMAMEPMYREVCDLQIFLENLKKAIDNLQLNPPSAFLAGAINRHKGPCVALLKSSSHRPVLAFSGYFDYERPEGKVYTHLSQNHNEGPRNAMKAAADKLGYRLFLFTDEYAKKIYVYGPLKKQGDYKGDGPKQSLMEALRNYEIDFRGLVEIKACFSCCERKLLAYLEVNGVVPEQPEMYIKWPPCTYCRPILDDWQREHFVIPCHGP